ncbi:cation:proton antiporter [Rubricoccus marinus]|uniref:PTS EIIA type-2 domain-containing protein n=1 Tax=Rubricoccus marinus TaxID=716817 RepID=A0A259U349_9BACT|nr:cation:proton antiporter [Rubricoccus marinus]OZC04406.1 hypothetical protein BSZ36_16315 [Rubricoccus marinus]
MLLALDLSLPLTEPVAVFTAVLLVLLAAPLVGRRGIPSSVVLLLAGVALGPNALGVLARDPTMVLLGTVGLLYIMFLAGLEIDLHEFIRHRKQSLVFGSLTFALPQVVGTAVGILGFGMGWPAAILLGSVFASHTLLAYPAAARLGLQKENAVTTAVGATILTDTLALLVLAVIASGARSGASGAAFDPLVLVRVAGPLALFSVAVLWGVPRAGAWFLRRAAQDATVEFVFVLAVVFACALSVEALGVEPIIGAFLAGLALNRLVPEGSALMNRVGFVGNALFVPFFLLATGMLVDLGAFVSGPDVARSWAVAGAMVGSLLFTKGAAAWATRPAFGYTADEARLVFGLTVPQAAATLAAVLVGVEVGLFDAAILNGTIAMVMVTCLVGPWLVESAGRRLALTAESRAAHAPLARRPRLLVSLSNPASVEAILDLALLAHEPDPATPIVAVTVVDRGADPEAEVARGERLLSAAVVHAAGADVPVLPLVRSEANVARALARAATETRATTLVMGWDGSATAERLLFGTIPDRVLRETSAAVLVARGGAPLATVGRLVVVVPPLAEGEPGFAEAAHLLAGLASRAGAGLAVLTPEAHREGVLAAFGSRRGGPKPEPLALDDWKGAPEALAQIVRPSDALALVSARPGAIAWSAAADRLPRTLAQQFPGHPLLVLYPGQAPGSGVLPRPDRGERTFLDRLGPDGVRISLRPGSVDDLVRQTLASAFSETNRSAAREALLAAPPEARTEIRPGVLLLHARTAAVRKPLLALGTSAEGLSVPGASGAVHVVVMFVAPLEAASPAYLGWLALLARTLHADATVEALRSAPTPEAAIDALLLAAHSDANSPEASAEISRGRTPAAAGV